MFEGKFSRAPIFHGGKFLTNGLMCNCVLLEENKKKPTPTNYIIRSVTNPTKISIVNNQNQ